MTCIRDIWTGKGRAWATADHNLGRSAAIGCAAVLLGLSAAGCGSSSPSGSGAPSASPASNSSNPQEPNPTAASFDFTSSADCLDQFSGNGATRGTEGDAQTAEVSVPDSGGWDHFQSVEVYFFPTPNAAAKFAKNGHLEKTETIVTGNVVVSGSAVAYPYSKDAVLRCLKPA